MESVITIELGLGLVLAVAQGYNYMRNKIDLASNFQSN